MPSCFYLVMNVQGPMVHCTPQGGQTLLRTQDGRIDWDKARRHPASVRASKSYLGEFFLSTLFRPIH